MKDEENKSVDQTNLKLTKNSKVSFDHPFNFSVPWGWSVLFILSLIGLYYYNQAPSKPLPSITRILVEKHAQKMTVYQGDTPLRDYRIALGSQPKGPKVSQGDGRTPEGHYKIIAKNGSSKFHLSLKLSYPNEKDLKQAIANNVPPGNDIMIHGLGKGFEWVGRFHAFSNWTRGCIAVTNPEIEEIYAATSIGTPVDIKP
ncbi:MAG: L,D-transpeptidase family protein [Alphaproteobacteria bacterium]|jgi:murein L,D-transpeptidase YafK|nr:L,D-transpeptidase family protein [Alphaproteobacteria bacterium]